MYLPSVAIALLLCSCQPIDGFRNGKYSKIERTSNQIVNKNWKSPIIKSTSTALSVGSILPTVYSAVAVASVIAFHEAGDSQDLLLLICR